MHDSTGITREYRGLCPHCGRMVAGDKCHNCELDLRFHTFLLALDARVKKLEESKEASVKLAADIVGISGVSLGDPSLNPMYEGDGDHTGDDGDGKAGGGKDEKPDDINSDDDLGIDPDDIPF